MARQIIVHAGFHKTGTTTIQAALRANGPLIWPTHAIVLPHQIKDATRMATAYSVFEDPFSLAEMRHRLSATLKTLDLGKHRGLILSAEDLAGLIPGRRAHLGYIATPALMEATATAIKDSIDGPLEITFVFGLRQSDSWLRSTYWQNLRSSRLAEDYDSYAERLKPHSDLEPTAMAVAARLPDVKVRTYHLEQAGKDSLGPFAALAMLMTLKPGNKEKLTAVPRRNVAPDAATIAEVIALNKSSLSDDDLAARKAALLGDGTDPANPL